MRGIFTSKLFLIPSQRESIAHVYRYSIMLIYSTFWFARPVQTVLLAPVWSRFPSPRRCLQWRHVLLLQESFWEIFGLFGNKYEYTYNVYQRRYYIQELRILQNYIYATECSLNIFFSRMFNILRSLPRQHWAAIGWKDENGQPIGVTVH